MAFVTKEAVNKLLEAGFSNRVVVIDTNEFESMMRVESNGDELKLCNKVSVSDTAAILYSSGTKGNIKGVKLTHRNIISSLAGAIDGRQTRSSPAVYLCTAPYFHSYGFNLCLRSVAFGDSLVSIGRFDLRRMLTSIEEFKVTHLPLAPPVVAALVNSGNEELVNATDWRSVETVFSGGAPLTVAVIGKFKRRFPNVSLVQAYGLTKTTAGVSRISGPYESTVVGTVGRLIANCEAKIVDPNTGAGLPPMNRGELWVRGPFVMKGYVDDGEVKDTMVDSDGWLRTGDLCYFDNEGFLFVVDQLKELIKYKGYQVPPAELEHILQSHPDIIEAAVIPYPDESAGQVPMGFVVRRKGSTINVTQVKDYVAKQVAPYKKLRRVCFIDSIPKTASGKILRKDLIKMALSGIASKL
ncbi:4-coumarate--CoA ligase-like 9 [Bidens hawaiensis]|uniref:4-coumarate--CoA ligase-like 9 n=1 Tax=Bidens hawaiensis TaxID=980011 RepID=UPI004049521F